MLTCDRCRAALLDRQYGLLDATEMTAIETHLGTCSDCRAEQARVERFGRLLSAAAKREFPEVQFIAPDDPTVAREATPSAQQRGWRVLTVKWSAATVAAALLLAIGIPAASHVATVGRQRTELARALQKKSDLENIQRETVAQHTTEMARADSALHKAQSILAATRTTLSTNLEDSRRELLAKQLNFVVSGPASVQAGAPSEYRVQTRDPAGHPTAAIVTYQVKDQTDKAVSEKTSVVTQGDVTVKLPPTLPLTPNRSLVLEVAAERTGGPKAVLREQLKIAAPVYVTHLTTDKPLYQPGEIVHFRSLTLDRAMLKPAEEPLNLQFVVRDPLGAEVLVMAGTSSLVKTDGRPLLGPDGAPVQGIGTGEWTIPATAKGGEYTLAVKEAGGRFPEERRKILVNQYQPARLNKVLEWSRKTFGPGDEVVANCKVTNAAGAIAHQPVTATAVVDGRQIPVTCGPTDSDGAVAIRFALPKEIDKGEGSLTIAFTDGGSHESLVKPIPIALRKLFVDFYAEGGELIADTVDRVYFQARTTLGKPADLKGRIVDETGSVVATAETLTDESEPGVSQGMGRFEFTPGANHVYRLVIDQPAGTEGEHKLPAVKANGVVLTALNEVSGDPDPIRVRVSNRGTERTFLVGAYARGRLLDHRSIIVPTNQSADVALNPHAGVGGVTRVTVFEEIRANETGGEKNQLVPRAERLIYRKPGARLDVAVDLDKRRYLPGERVNLSLHASDEKNQAMPAIAMIGVVNRSVVTMADEKTFRTMPTHFLLTSEVRRPEDLEHADVLLGSHPKASAALDLLLGTQGWRRFAEQNVAPSNQKDDGDRILLAQGNSPRIEATSLMLAAQKVKETYGPAVDAAQKEVAAAAEQVNRLRSDAEFAGEQKRLAGQLAEATTTVRADQADLSVSLASRDRVLRWASPVAAGVCAVLAVACLVAGFWCGVRYYIAAAGSLAAAAVAALVFALNVGGTDTRAEFASNSTPASEMNGIDSSATSGAIGGFGGGAEGRKDVAIYKADAPIPVAAALKAPAPMAAPAAPAAMEPPAGAARKPEGDPQGLDWANRLGDLKELGDGADKELVLNKKLAPRMRGLNAAANNDGLLAGRLAREAEVDLGFARGGGGGFGPADRAARGGRRMGLQRTVSAFIVREYAHQHAAAPAGDRTDFAETVFWHPVLVLPREGAKVSFDLADEVTRYQVLVAAHTTDGCLGAVETQFEARKPITVEPKLPVEISAGDRVDVPVACTNDTDTPRAVTLAGLAKGLNLLGNSGESLTLSPQQSGRRVFSFQPAMAEGKAELRLSANSQPFADDSVVRTISVVPEGFPILGSISGTLEGKALHEIKLPEKWIAETLKCQVTVYPSTLAELQKGLEALLAEPGGCFEQTSTTNYPNALVLQYLKESNQAHPEAMKRAKDLLERGYARLTAFEVPDKSRRQGFEWFGQFPAHEALTAYGLMQFRDMARVSDVDPQLLRRTQEYLLARRDGKGGFTRNPLALDSFGRAPDDVTNSYIIWALTESGKDDDITKELNAVATQAKASEDPYLLALVANCLLNRDRADEAIPLLRKLAGKLTKEGCLIGAKTSITGSAGRTLGIETTALAILAWLKADKGGEFTPSIRAAVTWIGKQRGGHGGFGSTQSTILALKALIAYTKANKKTADAGELGLAIGDRVVAKLAFAAGAEDALTVALPAPEQHLKPGKNELRVELTGKNSFPYTLTWSYQTLQPPSSDGCAVKLTTALDRPTLAEGETARLKVRLENVSEKGQGMAVAIVGLPAGLNLPDDFAQLKDLARPREDGAKPGRIGAFEIRGRELVLYWRDLAPNAAIDLDIDVRALVPGVYHGPASRAYLYYNPDVKYWTSPLAATIRAME
jgi:hypothetical protein